MSWTSFLQNPRPLGALFDDPAGLERLALHEVTLDLNGNRVRIRADLPRFPDRPSPRWGAAANRAQVTLSLWGAHAVRVEGEARTVDGTMDGELTMRRIADDVLEFSFRGAELVMDGRCDLVTFDGVTAYIQGAG